MPSDWKAMTPEQKVEAVKAGIAEGKSASQIAALYENATRNAVISAARNRVGPKLQLPGSFMEYRMNRAAAKAKQDRPRTAKAPTSKPGKVVTMPKAKRAPTPEFIPVGVEFIRLTERTCKWPLWDRLPLDASTAKHCGEHTDAGPWCERHRTKATMPVRTA